VRRLVSLTLGVMTAIGGFVDIGNLVTSGISGARFRASLTWAIVLATVAIIVYGEMAGRVAAIAGRTVFDTIRERLGARLALVNLGASLALNVLTLAAEIGGVALSLELASDVNYLLWVPLAGALMWAVAWQVPFRRMEQVYGLLGLTLLVFVSALVVGPTDWSGLLDSAVHPAVPAAESHLTWWFYAVSLYGACVVPYQVFFFSSGGIEEHWSEHDLSEVRLNTFVGFSLGSILSIAIMWAAATVLAPAQVSVNGLGEVALPAAVALGRLGLAVAIVGFVAATFGAGLETALSTGYIMCQYFGWNWGKMMRPRQAPEFAVVNLVVLVVGTALVLTTVDPVRLTLVTVVLSAAALPLTYFPILVVANDRGVLGNRVNGPVRNLLGGAFLVVLTLAGLAALPLLFLTKAGQ
jgi:manganese transport protein